MIKESYYYYYCCCCQQQSTLGMPDSSCRMICVLRAILALNLVGRPSASSKELVWSDCVPPNTAASASTVVRTMLLYGSWTAQSTSTHCSRLEPRELIRMQKLCIVGKTEWWGAGVVICLERCADLHMALLMPFPLTVSCFSKIQTGFYQYNTQIQYRFLQIQCTDSAAKWYRCGKLAVHLPSTAKRFLFKQSYPDIIFIQW